MDAEPVTEPNANAGKKEKEKEKRFECSHCSRKFARLEHLQRHDRIHSGIKPFSCSECNYSFTRSDLLVRHERLTHQKEHHARNHQNSHHHTHYDQPPADSYVPSDGRPQKRMRHSFDSGRPVPEIPSMMTPSATLPMDMHPPHHPHHSQHSQHSHHPHPPSVGPISMGQHDEYSLAALSMAAEYQAMQGMGNGATPHHEMSDPLPLTNENITRTVEQPVMHPPTAAHLQGPSVGESLDSLTAFLDHEPLSSYHFASLINTEQPMPFFSPESFTYGHEFLPPTESNAPSVFGHVQSNVDETHSFSRFGSRLPSLQPDDITQHEGLRTSFSDISINGRQKIANKLEEFSSVVPSDFRLPTRLALCRYTAAYINGFHEHMPFLHVSSMSVDTCSVELILAIAAVGAQYTFEGEKGVELFNASRAIATYRIRRRDARLVEIHRRTESARSSSYEPDASSVTARSPARTASTVGPLGLPTGAEYSPAGEDLMQTAQALLLLMALCTWAKHKEILREALAIQSILATLIRDDGLSDEPLREELPWQDWIRRETIKRTKFIVYGFSNLHCIVYNIPPFIMTSEVKLTLPCSAAEFRVTTESAWRELRKRRMPEIQFQDALQKLFTKNGRDVTEWNSSAGNYALIHALIQHIFFVRQVARCRFDGQRDLSQDDVTSLENALRNWQVGWKKNPESSLDPMSPDGPVAFNSTALLRLAYIRLYVDTAGRALETRDPVLIANAFRAGPAINRSPKITRAVLHSAHALSIPVKIGYRLVAKTQSFIWSIQHSLCTLECAYLMSKWLEALSEPNPEPPVTEDEERIAAIVKSMLDETEFALPADISSDSPGYTKYLSAGVLRVWATIFKGAQTWAIVDVIGSALNLYADMLESE
ncbi:hypothetical protein P280DRAFT_278666 [Massarina eburnea CBS 473.64]|uniref:C2H2-type domain-containing protein n=1 Tax=Massarina eburnea CBS 473.64 TaxID=1395130 RepID=A0A6A6RH50_9PLEO|nr:hypothetical protein P280DRAFT_278666 [Massarina eburnea CBS 473.64]